MQQNGTIWQRIMGHLVLFVLALLLFMGWRLIGANRTETTSAPREATAVVLALTPASPSNSASTGLVAGELPSFTDSLPVFYDDSLAPQPNPHTFQGNKAPDHQFEHYVVVRGDTPNKIAERYGISPSTLLGGNPSLSEEASLLQVGADLIILPVDGVLHDVRPGDSPESIAQQYGIPTDEIIAYGPNNLEFPYRLYPDTQILVPGAVRELFVWTAPTLDSVRRSSGGGIAPLIVGTGTFVYPVSSRNLTQYYWYGHPGIDIALAEGSAVFASDTGTVTYAGWNIYGFGNLIVVNHGNGYETFYGHLSGINVSPGQIVYQGNAIGATGNTGNSSGPHIHFEIRLNGNQDDPCWYIGGC